MQVEGLILAKLRASGTSCPLLQMSQAMTKQVRIKEKGPDQWSEPFKDFSNAGDIS
jgi:hypothetical protein